MRNKLTDELAVCGLNAVMAAAEYHPDHINRLFLREDRLKSFAKICKTLAERKHPYKICEDEELERICKTPHHQGVVAMIRIPEVEPLSREDLEEWAREGSRGLVLHAVGNDHNLGAMARSAAFFDVKYIVISGADDELSAGRAADGTFPVRDFPLESRLTTSAYRIAEGGMEHVTVRSVRSTAAFLRDASRVLVTIAADARARRRIGDLPRIIEEKRKETGGGSSGIAVVLGNEETGLPDEVRRACSVIVRIPGTGVIDSLNVAQAATLFMQKIFEL